MSKPLLFSDWLRQQSERQDDIGAVSREWNALPPKARKGRINAKRLDDVLGGSRGAAVISAYGEATGRTA